MPEKSPRGLFSIYKARRLVEMPGIEPNAKSAAADFALL